MMGSVWFWVWGALVALSAGITGALPTNYFMARRRFFFTSGGEHALIFINRRLQPPFTEGNIR